MIVAVTPATGVTWSLPSRRGRSYAPDVGSLGHQRVELARSIVRRRSMSTLAMPERGRQRLGGLELAGQLGRDAREVRRRPRRQRHR